MTKTAAIKKFRSGGLADLANPGIPKAVVEVYIRDKDGDTFHVDSLEEGMQHLLSNEGYRLTIKTWPDGAGFDRPSYAVRIWRFGNELRTELEAPFLAYPQPANEVKYDLDRKPVHPDQMGEVKVVSLNDLLDLPPSEETEQEPEPAEYVDVVIDGS